MPGEFFDQSGALIPATGGQMPFDFGQWMQQQGQQLKTNVGPLFSGTPQGNAALGTLLGTTAAAVAPEGSWQQKLGAAGANMGKTAASQLQTKGVGGGPSATPLVNANNKLTQDVVNAPTPPQGSLQTTGDLLKAGQQAIASTTPGVAPQSSNIMTGVRASVPVSKVPDALPANMSPTVPGGGPAPAPAPQASTPQAGAPPANFPVAPAPQVPSLEGQVPSAIGQGAGLSSDVDSNMLAIGLGDPKTFQDNYKMISDARSKEMTGTAHLGQAAENFRKLQIPYALDRFGGDLLNTQRTLENTTRHGQVLDDLQSNDVARIEARSREYDALPLNPVMQRKFGVQSWGQLMRMNPQAVQAFGAQLHYDSAMAQVSEMAKGRADQKDYLMWTATQKDLSHYADKFTAQEWAELQAKDPNKARMLLDSYAMKGTSPVMTASEAAQYEMSNQQMDALSTRLGLATGYADRARKAALEAVVNPVMSQAVFENRQKQVANQQRQAEFALKADMLRRYGAQIPAGMVSPPSTSALDNPQGMAFDTGPNVDAIFDYLRQADPNFAAEYEARMKQIRSQTVPKQ